MSTRGATGATGEPGKQGEPGESIQSISLGGFVLAILVAALISGGATYRHLLTTHCRLMDNQQFCVGSERVYSIRDLGTPEDRHIDRSK
jgi:hypothetical protein